MRQRGLTFIELLVALLLLAIALIGLVGLWAFGLNVTAHSQDMGAAYNVARQEIERARNVGFLLLPEGSWTADYDGLGNPTSDPVPHFTATCQVTTIPDANGEINTGCVRTLTVQVSARDRGGPLFETTTYFTRGGL